jgi:hypothetical protein
VVADVDGDGKADVVVASTDNAGTDYLSILTGNGDGSLNGAQSFTVPRPAVGQALATVIAADLRHTGHPDLVGSNGVVFLNNGNGTFTQGTQAFPVLAASSNFGPNMVAADLNHDGNLDLAVDTGGLIRIFIGHGDGTFSPGESYASIDNVGYLTASDLDTDGNMDLWSGLSGGGEFVGDQYGPEQANALMGNGDGTFQGAPSLPFVYTGTNLADLNGDGIADAVGVNTDLSLTSYIGSAKGSFTTGSAIATSPFMVNGSQDSLASIDALAIADVDRDGKPDLILSGTTVNGPTASTLLLLRGNGQGGFAAPTPIALPSFATSGQTDTNLRISGVRVVDVNGDGKPDLIYNYTDLLNPSQTYLAGSAVQLGNGDGTFQPAVSLASYTSSSATITTPVVVATADVNGDGKPDLILIATGTTYDPNLNGFPGQLQVALGHGDGTFSTPANVAGPDLTGGIVYGTEYAPVVITDVNGDGKPDLVAVGASASTYDVQLTVSLGNGDGTFQAPTKLTLSSGQYLSGIGLAVADFNGDGKPDVALTNPFSLLSSGIVFGNGDGSFQYTGDVNGTYVNQDIALALYGAAVTYDINGDGKPDLLVGSTELLSQSTSGSSGGSGSSSSGGGTTADYSMSISPSSVSVAPGASATATITVTPTGGFSQDVALSCSGLPSGASCSFAPTTLKPSGAAASSTLTIGTAAPTTARNTPYSWLFGSTGGVLATMSLPLFWRRRSRGLRRLRGRAPLALYASAGTLLLLLVSCGGGGGGATSGGGSSGTAAGTYHVTVTGVSGTVSHTATLTLTVS